VESSAFASSFPPPSARSSERPGLVRAYPRGCETCATPRQLKAEALELLPLTGMGKRESARAYGRPWETVRGWLDPRALDRTPPPEFVRWLRVRVEIARLSVLEQEARSR
jgi:hypothetical protein